MKELLKGVLKRLGLFDWVKRKHVTHTRLTKKYTFENRMKNKEKICFVLAGYKEFTYEILFKRIKRFVPEDTEVCILSSGIYSNKLSEIAKENDWSYLSTKRNCVSLLQNVAINVFSSAKYIYKLDEDIFVTEGCFETLFRTMQDCEKNGEYKVGFVAPTIPINGFGHLNVLKRFNLVETYKEKFEKPIYAAGPDRMVENNPDAAKFFWGEWGYLPTIDEMNEALKSDEFRYVACPVKFSIGAIMFSREFWDSMGMFEVRKGSCMGLDEGQICQYCIVSSRPIIVSMNTIVGHLSFGKQNETMKEYYMQNKELFDIDK